jgi:hypothetical protein
VEKLRQSAAGKTILGGMGWEIVMRVLLVLLVLLTLACGAGIGVTVSLAPAYADHFAAEY